MKAKAFQIHWHNKQPIYSVDFHPKNLNKLATCGGDNNVRIWNVVNANESSSEEAATVLLGSGLRVEYLATLTKHMKSVNCVRFSPSGDFLASAGDGGFVILWKQSDTAPLQFNKAFGDDSEDEEDTDRKEFWSVAHQFRAMDGEDVYDLAWSPDGKYLILGLTDNTAQIWDTQSAKCVKILKDHQHFVQGVSWDPLNQFLVTQSSDRSAKVWVMKNGSKGLNYFSLSKYSKISPEETNENTAASYSIFHDETLVSFFRRPSFSPDGSLLCLPTGQRTPLTPKCNNSPHGIYLNLRNNLHKTPTAFIGGFEKAAIAIRFSPRLFQLIQNGNSGEQPVVPLSYRMIFAVVTQNSVYIFDTQNKAPLFVFSNLHYASLTDAAWSCDGAKLVASSVDGFCTVAEFDPIPDFGGEPMSMEESEKILKEISCLVTSIPFFNPPVSLNVKKQVNLALGQDVHVMMSSEIDILIEMEDDDMDPVEEVNKSRNLNNMDIDIRMGENTNNSMNIIDENSIKSPEKTKAPIIHNPPVKRRIVPTLLSKDFKEKLEANLLTLNKFEGLENDLIQQHGNLRSQFSEYREAIEAANLSEKEKREHYGHHDELVKKLHKLILEAKALARKRTEQMTRDELFKLSQERQKSVKPQSAEDKIGEEVTKSLKRMLETMRSEVERSSSNISTARETTKNLQGTTENYEKLSGTLEESRSLIRDLWKKNRNDMIYIIGALGVFMATAVYVILQRTPGIVWLPGKMILRQIGNMIPKSSERTGKFVERVVEMTEAVLSDSEDAPDMFVDRILSKEEYGNDDLLKQEEEKEGDTVPVIIERAEPEVESDRENSLISSDDQESTISETGISTSNSVETITAESAQISTTQATEVKDNVHKTPVEVSTQKVTESVEVAENHVEFIEKNEILNEIVENTQKLDSHEISVINTAINDSAIVEEPTKVGESLIVNETTLNNEAPDSVPVQVEEPLVANAISQNDNPNTLNAEIVTESAYYTTTESEFEGNQAIYSSDTELFSGIEGNMDL